MRFQRLEPMVTVISRPDDAQCYLVQLEVRFPLPVEVGAPEASTLPQELSNDTAW